MQWAGTRGWLRVESIPMRKWLKKMKPLPKLYKLRGFGLGGQIGCHVHNMINMAISIFHRVLTVQRDGQFVETTPPSEALYRQRFRQYVKQLKRYTYETPPVTRDVFLSRQSGNSRRFLRYQRALANLGQLERNNDVDLDRLSRLSNFVKVEKLLSTKLAKAPRNISPRSPEYNILLGCHIAHLEKILFRILQRVCGFPVVFKGMNCLRQGQLLRQHWDEFEQPVAIDLDASRFDQHQHVSSLKVEHEQWLRMVPSSSREELSQLLHCQLLNKGSSLFRLEDGSCMKVSYQVEGTRASGDMNTSSGNCFTMVGMVYSYMQTKQIKWRLANNGDDCVLIVDKRNLHHLSDLQEWFGQMGYTMESNGYVEDFEKIVFCQTQPVYTPDGYKMVRQPQSALLKDINSRCDLSREKVFDLWCSCVRKGGLALAGDIPIYQAFYQAFPDKHSTAHLQEVAAVLETGFTMLSKGLQPQIRSIEPRTRYSFWKAFGITPKQQLVLEQHFSQVQVGYQQPSFGNLFEGVAIDRLVGA
ncbi:hypothetical protein 2 [Sanxia tombus-like virus 1]|uniref:hypothetical protein 2 n=1 Tax=Sanxia tombus-like virus 1 TaxID=1923385 RepID=UPI0009096B1F|nr:hypothetical protein 2 [Sanxia tombus-like virus 1]APG76445.1 hypothetical protein 2 [Sanxia tombus-like virus 1]APG76539.1 hypothetical protein 2 [Sanxia tombus-like virus 1]